MNVANAYFVPYVDCPNCDEDRIRVHVDEKIGMWAREVVCDNCDVKIVVTYKD